MDYYEDDLSYYNNFWINPDILYSHFKAKFMELKSLGLIFQKLSYLSDEFSQGLLKAIKISENIGTNSEKSPKQIKTEQ